MMECHNCIEKNIYIDKCEWCGVSTVCPQSEKYWDDLVKKETADE